MSFAAVAIAGGAVAVGGLVGKGISNAKNKKILNRGIKEDPVYAQSMYAKNQLGLAQTMFGGRMAGAGAQQQNIENTQASMLGGASRNVGDSSRMLAIAGMAQGQSNEAFGNLGMAESQNKYSMLNNLNTAYGGMISEDDKSFDNRKRLFDNKMKVLGINAANSQAMWQSVTNLGTSALGFGAAAYKGPK